jgi:hypothetical protein
MMNSDSVVSVRLVDFMSEMGSTATTAAAAHKNLIVPPAIKVYSANHKFDHLPNLDKLLFAVNEATRRRSERVERQLTRRSSPESFALQMALDRKTLSRLRG